MAVTECGLIFVMAIGKGITCSAINFETYSIVNLKRFYRG